MARGETGLEGTKRRRRRPSPEPLRRAGRLDRVIRISRPNAETRAYEAMLRKLCEHKSAPMTPAEELTRRQKLLGAEVVRVLAAAQPVRK
jgi:ATP-dependent 26S proteasome regulatory subunit